MGAVFIAIVLVIVAEILCLDVIKGQQVPTLAVAKHVAPYIAMIFAPVLLVCIYSAVASLLMVVTRKFATDKTLRYNLVAIILTAVGMFFGTLLPFDQLVNILYPLSGYFAILLGILIVYKEFINKNAFPYEKSASEQEGQKHEE